MSRIKRLEAIEAKLLHSRGDAASLRQFTTTSILELVAVRLHGLAEDEPPRDSWRLFGLSQAATVEG